MDNIYITSMVMILRLGIGVILFRLALNPRYHNLHWLAAVFYLNFINLFLRDPALFPLPLILMIVIHICLALFTHTTFYQHRRSPVAWIIGGFVVVGALPFFTALGGPLFWGVTPLHLMCAINWFWHALVAWQVWRKLRLDRSIEDWIKVRYTLVVAYATLMGMLFLLPVWRSSISFVGLIGPVGMMVGLVLQYLAWGMPAALRRHLNRNYRPPVTDATALNVTEDDILRELQKQSR
ncbi:MAG: hypothetical protein JXO72_14285 [Vicinamibacteria bacterium]|nr:hypothetical protein [Vicinamibacteria bacterium]